MKRENAIEIDFPFGNLDQCIDLLLKHRDKGESVYIDFNGTKLYSCDVTVDSAYHEVLGCSKEEFFKEMMEKQKKREEEEKACAEREKEYARRVAEERAKGETTITTPLIVNGLKFIAENQTLNHQEFFEGLLKLGCTFTRDDIKDQMPGEHKLEEGMKSADLAMGAYVIAHARDKESTRLYVNEKLLGKDDEYSIYHFIRTATGDNNYTKESLGIN